MTSPAGASEPSGYPPSMEAMTIATDAVFSVCPHDNDLSCTCHGPRMALAISITRAVEAAKQSALKSVEDGIDALPASEHDGSFVDGYEAGLEDVLNLIRSLGAAGKETK